MPITEGNHRLWVPHKRKNKFFAQTRKLSFQHRRVTSTENKICHTRETDLPHRWKNKSYHTDAKTKLVHRQTWKHKDTRENCNLVERWGGGATTGGSTATATTPFRGSNRDLVRHGERRKSWRWRSDDRVREAKTSSLWLATV